MNIVVGVLMFVLFTVYGWYTFVSIYGRECNWDIYAMLYILWWEGVRSVGLLAILYVVKFIIYITGGLL